MTNPVTIVQSGSRYEARFKFDPATKDAVKSAGFRFDWDKKTWWTDKPAIAAKFADPDAARKMHDAKIEAIEASRATSAQVDIPVPAGLAYLPFQLAGIAYAMNRPSVMIGDEMGLGKTIQAIGISNADPAVRSVLVICPASLKLNWQREWQKWDVKGLSVGIANGKDFPATEVVVVNYDIIGKHRETIDARQWDLMITDECHYCFPGDTKVKTNVGKLSIAQIVNNRLLVSVLSCDLSSSVVEYQQVTGWLKFDAYTNLVEVVHESGRIVCTEDHPIWTENGYMEASKITSGTHLRILRQNVFDTDQREKYRSVLQPLVRSESHEQPSRSQSCYLSRIKQAENRKKMRTVRKALLLSFKRRKQKHGKAVLLQLVRRLMESEPTWTVRRVSPIYKQSPESYAWKKTPRYFRKNEKEQSYQRPRSSRENQAGKRRAYISVKRGKRPNNRAAANCCRTNRLPDRVPHSHSAGQGDVRVFTTYLRRRFGRPVKELGNRNRRGNAQNPVVEISRSSQNRSFERSRVVSVKVYERGSSGGPDAGSQEDQFVYCLGVAKNHNFFADGVLVSNCKNPDTIRTKAVLGNRKAKAACIAAKRRVFLTGTPIVNRPVELWPLVSALDPNGLGRSFWSYAQRYCGATNNGFGWDFGGASHLDELQEKLRSTFMVRRLKSEVLTELPPKVRQVIEIPANGLSGLVAKESAMAQRHEDLMDALRAAAELAKAEGAEAFNVAVKNLRDAGSVAFEEMAQARHDLALAKVPYLVEHLEDAIESSGKVVVMVWHRDVIAALMEKFGDRAVQVHGGVNIADRQAAVDRFQTDPTCQVFVGSIKAAGVGLTLTAASHVVFGELWWVPGDITQAEDRCHRIGQADSVLIQHLVVDGSLDARMAKVMVAKQAVIDYALDKGLTLPEPPDAPVVLWADEADETETEPEKAKAPATKGMTVDQIEADAAKLTDAQVDAVHEALRTLAALNPDRASERNDMGFNRYDTRIGMELAAMPALTKRQAALGAKMVRKYHRQLSADLLATVKGE